MPTFHSLFDNDKSRVPSLNSTHFKREKVFDKTGKRKITSEMSPEEISKIVSEEITEIIKKVLAKKKITRK